MMLACMPLSLPHLPWCLVPCVVLISPRTPPLVLTESSNARGLHGWCPCVALRDIDTMAGPLLSQGRGPPLPADEEL